MYTFDRAFYLKKVSKVWENDFLKIPMFDAKYIDKNSIILHQVVSDPKTNKSEGFSNILHRSSDSRFVSISPPLPQKPGSKLTYSPSGKRLCVLSSIANPDANNEESLFEFYSLVKREFSASFPTEHEKVYPASVLGGIEWNKDEDKIVYIAERKKHKKTSLFDLMKKQETDETNKGPKKDDKPDEKEDLVDGDKFLWEQDWGETLVGVLNPQPFVLDIKSCKTEPIKNLPHGYSFGSPAFVKNGEILFVGYKSEPYRKGLYAYNTRESGLFLANSPDSVIKISIEHAVSEPKVSPDGNLAVYLSTGDDRVHLSGSDVRLIDFDKNKNVSLFDPVPDESAEHESVSKIFSYGQPNRVWAGDSRSFVLQTFKGSKGVLVHFDTVRLTRRVIELPSVKSIRLIDVYANKALVGVSSPNESENVFELSLDEPVEEHCNLAAPAYQPICEDLVISRFDFDAEIVRHFPRNRGFLSKTAVESLLLLPKMTKNGPCPLVMLFHGGPHGIYPTSFLKTAAFLCSLGFAVCAPNFTGSIGFGKEFLLGSIGNHCDVEDVLETIENLEFRSDRIDLQRIGLLGGSYGGYLTCFLIGKHPGRFRAAVALNPVTDMSAMANLSDIPGYAFVETGLHETDLSPAEKHKKMFEFSPVSMVENVKTPTLLLLGKKDARVPYLHSKPFVNRLREMGVPSRAILYKKGTHSLRSDVEMETDVVLQSAMWLAEHLESTKHID